ncbi:hypothetical protein AU375_02337 [Methylobacterium radiotolerans]|nr:hypothetical protein AU375_02337 [Methylobacterium radiotolerans]
MIDKADPFVVAIQTTFQDRFPGATIAPQEDERVVERRLQDLPVARAPWSSSALRVHRLGWTVFPQTRDERRAPGSPYGHMVRHGVWQERKQTLTDVADMLGDSRIANHNVAIALGEIPGVFVLDLDITDPAISGAFLTFALRRLGQGFVRSYWQNSGKLGLIYRMDPGDPIRESRRLPVLDPDGGATKHVVEVLAKGKAYTILGTHYRAGSVFRYRNITPAANGPEYAAMVSAAQLQAFLEDAAQEVCLLGALKRYGGRDVVFHEGAIEALVVEAGNLVVPGSVTQVRNVTFNAEGKVVDGREAFLTSRAFAYCIRNPGLAATPQGRHALAGRLAQEAHDRWDGLGDHHRTWHGGHGDTDVLCCARARIESAARTAANRPDFVQRVGRDETGRLSLVQRAAIAAPKDVGDLAWLTDDEKSSVLLRGVSVDGQAEKRLARAIVTDQRIRDREQERVSATNRMAIDRFVGQTRERHADPSADVPAVILLKAPTGAGKTSLAVEVIAEDVARHGACGPRLFLLPSYNNIDEVERRAREGRKAAPGADYAAMAQAAANEARRHGLKVEVLTGKERGGCRMAAQLSFLRAQGQPASALCHHKERLHVPLADKDADPVYDETWCTHHPDAGGDCPVILARRRLADADLIFAPTVFLTNQLPEGLAKVVTGLVVDERCAFEMIRYAVMPLSALDPGNRGAPILTAKEKAEGVDAEGMAIERDHVAIEARRILLAGGDVAQAFHGDEKLSGMVESAITVCGRGQRSTGIKPNVTVEQLKEIFTVPERAGIREEHRFWSLVRDRIQALRDDARGRELVEAKLLPAEGRTWRAKGARDHRVQILDKDAVAGIDDHVVRLSWMDEPNLKGHPTLLLDASADPEIIGKCWSGRPVEEIRVDAYLHMRTVVCLDGEYASTGLDVGLARDDERAGRIAHQIDRVRRVETALAGIYGAGRIATFAAKRVRRAMRLAHGEGENVDQGHFGAVRGLDFAKDHKAILTVGRLEFPSWVYDAWAAALTYDDDVPEEPFDRWGNGLATEGGKIEMPTVKRTLPLRDGRDLTYDVRELPGRWGRAVQKQMREEELLQCAGRLRPVYRDGEPPVWVAMSSIVPEGIVVDAVTTGATLADLKGAAKVHEAVRRVGILDKDLIRNAAPDLAGDLSRALGLSGIALEGNRAAAGLGLDLYSVTVDGETREIYVPASSPDPISTAVEAYDRAGKRVASIRLVAKGATPVPSQRRAPDGIDEEIGHRDERRAAEDAARAAARALSPAELSQDPAEIFANCPPERLPPRKPVYRDIGTDVVLIGAGFTPEKANEIGRREAAARAELRARPRSRPGPDPVRAGSRPA